MSKKRTGYFKNRRQSTFEIAWFKFIQNTPLQFVRLIALSQPEE